MKRADQRKLFFSLLLACVLVFMCLVALLQPLTNEEVSNVVSRELLPTNISQEEIFGGYETRNGEFCRGEIEVLVLVHSAVTHASFRTVLRNYAPRNFKLLFLVGQVRDKGLQETIKDESKRFGDMVVGRFYDSYRNLTLKHLMGLHWAARHCSHADFVLKADDDIFVNYPLLNRFLQDEFPKSKDPLVTRTGHKLIAGFVQSRMQVIRNSTNKWFVSQDEFKGDVYPDFASGWAYLTTVETIASLLERVAEKRFWIDDVYVTGILRTEARDISLRQLNAKFNTDMAMFMEWLELGQTEPQKWSYLFSNTNGDVEFMSQAYELNRVCELLGASCRCCYMGQQLKQIPVANGIASVHAVSL